MMNRIKNFKLFLESIKDDDEFKASLSELKLSLFKMLKPIFVMEKIIRIAGDMKEIERGADSLIEILLGMFSQSLMANPNLDDNFRELILSNFYKSLKSSRNIFIEKSFENGVDKSLDFLVEFLEAIKKAAESEGEEWKKAKEVDYADMSKSEINDLIDQALDVRDFAKVKFLSQYLKESFEFTDEIKSGIEKFCDALVSLITKNYYVL